MSGRKTVLLLVLVMIAVAMTGVGIAIKILYDTALDEERERLKETAESQARLMEAVARYDRVYGKEFPGTPAEATLSQINDAHERYMGFGKTGEFTLAMRDDDKIIFLLRHRHGGVEHPLSIPFNSRQVEAMRRALSGQSGTVVSLDYRNQKVLAAYEPVGELNLGIVAKIDMAEIRAPFLKAGIVAVTFSILIVFAGANLFFRISNPLVKKLELRSQELERLNRKMADEIEQRRRSQAQIRSLSRQLLKAQEAERQMISRELHDRVAQDLSTVKIGCDTLFDGRSQVSAELKEKAGELSTGLHKAIMAVRDLSYDLRPPTLDQLGVRQAIFQYCEDFSEKTGLETHFTSAGMQGLRLNFDTEINLYRLVQEGLNNVAKHAGAASVTVKLVAAYPSIILRIEDDGRGFDVEKRLSGMTDEKRMGLRSMQERVSLLGGKMRIESRENHGTRIFVEVPYPEMEAGDAA